MHQTPYSTIIDFDNKLQLLLRVFTTGQKYTMQLQFNLELTKVPVSRMKHYWNIVERPCFNELFMNLNRAFQQCFNSVSSLRKLVHLSCEFLKDDHETLLKGPVS